MSAQLRAYILGAMHVGAMRPGDRLPSIRRTAECFAVTPYSALQAYATLESEGLVQRRERSGIFVGDLERLSTRSLPETGEWLAQVLTEACEHQLKVPLLPELIRRWTSAAPVRCLCVEECVDLQVTLSTELSQQFGMETVSMSLAQARGALHHGSGPVEGSTRPPDLVVTTAYHAAEVRQMADARSLPMLLATMNPLTTSASEARLRRSDLTVICADPLYGERLRALHAPAGPHSVRVVLADDVSALRRLDRRDPVLLTAAARQRLQRNDFRLVAPLSPAFSLDFARKVAETLILLNIEAERA